MGYVSAVDPGAEEPREDAPRAIETRTVLADSLSGFEDAEVVRRAFGSAERRHGREV
jgi:hypothetical protein